MSADRSEREIIAVRTADGQALVRVAGRESLVRRQDEVAGAEGICPLEMIGTALAA
jgi:hypothetical protein